MTYWSGGQGTPQPAICAHPHLDRAAKVTESPFCGIGVMAMKRAVWLLSLCACLYGTSVLAQDAAPSQDTAPPTLGAPAMKFLQETFAIHEALMEPTPPSLQDPVYAQQVAQAFDISRLDAMKDQPMPDLMGTCFRASAAQAAYLLRGVKKQDLDQFAIQDRLKSGASPAAIKLKRENYLRFQDELVMALRFGLACRKQQLERLETYLPQMPGAEKNVFRIGFDDFQQGLTEILVDHAAALRDSIRPENRQAAIDLLAQYGGSLAGGMTKPSRKTASAAIAKALTAPGLSPDDRKKLGVVQAALKRPDCGRVCAFR